MSKPKRKGGKLVKLDQRLTPQQAAKRRDKATNSTKNELRAKLNELEATTKRAKRSGFVVALNIPDALRLSRRGSGEMHGSPDPAAAAEAERALREGR